jgi:ATP-binding cassette subfamily C protein LapB
VSSDPTQKPDAASGKPQSQPPSQASHTQVGGAQSSETPTDTWPIEADRIAIHSPLVETLRIMAGHYGRRTSRSSLTAGLPIAKTGITPELFYRAAQRADLHAKLIERPLAALALTPNLPCILVLEHNQACILWEVIYPNKKLPRKEPGKAAVVHPETTFIVQFPETEDERHTLTFAELARLFTGYAFFIRPVARTDDRAGPSEIDTSRDWFWSALKENIHIYREVVLAAVVINLFAVASPLFIMNVYDRVVPNSAYETLAALAIGVFIVFIFDFILKNVRAHFLDVAGRRADVKISARLFEHIMGMTMASRPASAGVLVANMREFESLRDFFTSATMVALIDLPFTMFFIVIIAILAGPLAFIPLAAIPIIIAMGFYLQGKLKRIIKESLYESALKNSLLFETISGLETVKVHAAEGHTQRKWEELADESSRTSIKSRRISAFALNFAIFVQQITSVVVVIVGVFMITDGSITMGGLVASVIMTGRALAPMAQVAGLLTRLQQSRESLYQLNELMKKPVERPAGKNFISKPVVEGSIDFRDVIFTYPNQTVPALNHVNLSIQAGERVGIIGAVGSGKTTIERLILNLYQPESGSILLDGADVRQIDPGDLRRSVGAVQQSPTLFYGSVRENITMGHETSSESAILRAAQLAGVMEFLSESSHGLDTQVGERGEALSGGQRQAVAIARSLLYDPSVLILDEPTASMDPASEARLIKRLHALCQGKTTILITHKGPMLTLVDKLILIDRGRIVDFGAKDEIIRKLQARQYGSQAENTDV